jgi:guanylate kinase
VTSRIPPSGTENKDNYDTVTRDDFRALIGTGALAEWLNPFDGDFYGTLREPVEQLIADGVDAVFDYSPEGYLHLRQNYPDRVVGIFVMAPDLETMTARLLGRATETSEELKMRYQMALRDFNFVDLHDYQLVNDELDHGVSTLRAIRAAEHASVRRNPDVVRRYAGWAKPARLRYYLNP